MNKWVLLAIAVVMVLGAIQSIRWWRMMQKASTREIEKVAGYDATGMSQQQRNDVAKYSLLPMGLPTVTSIMVVLALAVVALTVRAFLE